MKNKAAKLLFIAAFTVLVFGCKKSDNKGKFFLELESISSTDIPLNGTSTLKFNFSHPNNEIQNDTLHIKRDFFTCPFSSGDQQKRIIPEYQSSTDFIGTYEFVYLNNGNGFLGCYNSTGSSFRTDSIKLTIWATDKNGKSSDTVIIPKIIVRK